MVINIIDLGADPNFKKDSTGAFKDALKMVKNVPKEGTLVIEVPSGEYIITETLEVPEQIVIKGPGPFNGARLNFKFQRRGPGIVINAGGYVHIEGINIENTHSNGIEIRDQREGEEVERKENRKFCQFKNIKVINAGIDIPHDKEPNLIRSGDSGASGFFCQNLWMSRFEGCWSISSRKFGFHFSGFHTSIKLDTCYADLSGDTGFYLNDAVYCNLINCASDGSKKGYGYFFSNCEGISINGSGSEDNYYSSIGLMASLERASINRASNYKKDSLQGITIQSFFSKFGNKGLDENFGHFITIVSDDNKLIMGSSFNHYAYIPGLEKDKHPPEIVKRGNSKHCINFPIFNGIKLVG